MTGIDRDLQCQHIVKFHSNTLRYLFGTFFPFMMVRMLQSSAPESKGNALHTTGFRNQSEGSDNDRFYPCTRDTPGFIRNIVYPGFPISGSGRPH
jgi:hypothetical protein